MAKIFAYKKINKLSINQWNELVFLLTASEVIKINRYKRRSDREIFLLSRALLKRVISEFIGIKPIELEFVNNEFGRPLLKYPKINNFNFNVSHSGDWIVIAINKNGPIGIDIEKIKSINFAVANNCFTGKEIEYLFNKNKKMELRNFYKIWTLKESFIKAIGKGLSFPLKDFYFEFSKDGNIKFKIKDREDNWHFKMYNIDKNYKLALCLDKSSFPRSINMLTI